MSKFWYHMSLIPHHHYSVSSFRTAVEVSRIIDIGYQRFLTEHVEIPLQCGEYLLVV